MTTLLGYAKGPAHRRASQTWLAGPANLIRLKNAQARCCET
jgi:hypothetical protein